MSGAFHSPLLSECREEYRQFLEEEIGSDKTCQGNMDFLVHRTVGENGKQNDQFYNKENLIDGMVDQLDHPVLFSNCLLEAVQHDYTHIHLYGVIFLET